VALKQLPKRKKVVTQIDLMTKQVLRGAKLIKKNQTILGTTGLNMVIDNPESVVEVVNSITSDDLILLFNEQSNLQHSQNAQQWKVSPETLKWPSITQRRKKILGIIISTGQVRKDNIKDNWSTDLTVSIPIFPHITSRNHF
jgi:hypothetical protein